MNREIQKNGHKKGEVISLVGKLNEEVFVC